MCLVCNTYPLSARVTQPSTVRCTGEFWTLKTSARGFELSATLPEATWAHAPRLINENTTPTKTTKYFCTNPPTTFFWAFAGSCRNSTSTERIRTFSLIFASLVKFRQLVPAHAKGKKLHNIGRR